MLALANQGAPVTPVIPADGVSAGYTPFGITTHGADNAAAQVFVNWQMSKAGQNLLGALGVVPARSDLPDQKAGDLVLPKPGDETFIIYTSTDQQEREKSVLDTWNTIFRYSG